MEHDGGRTAVALMPTDQSINLFVAVGALLDAALGGADLGPGNGANVASTVFLKTNQPAAEAITRIRAATARLTDAPLPDLVDPDPADVVGEPTVQGIALDGGITVSLSRPREQADQMAAALLEAFIPAVEELDAPNYIEFPAIDPVTHQKYAVIVVKPRGLTPHEARQQAEAECARLRELLDAHGIADPELVP